ncbi:hypothetical protein [uncultured Cetobacterium sp.]|uniref:hypothetical protein n=1 Tax=uncultured Cetobacterium sp. TaxID=527638 RepID=UPI00260D3258|nr:hypothetical protein [uncultured Cetobacterium sp.]
MSSDYYIDEDGLVELTGLSPRSIRSKFKQYRTDGKEYDYLGIAEDAIKEKYSMKAKDIFVDVESLAIILGTTEKTIQTYKNKKIILAETNGTFNLLANLEKYNKETSEYNKILKVKREREEVRKERDLLQLDIDERRYIPVELYAMFLSDTIVTFRQELLRTASGLSVNLKPMPHSQWKKYIEETLSDTLEHLNKLSDEVEEGIVEKIEKQQRLDEK